MARGSGKQNGDPPVFEKRVTRSSVKALSVSPTERAESPVPRTRSGVTPDVTTPLKNTPAKIRTRRASLADASQEVVGSPIRRSRRLSTNSEEVSTPTKTRSLRSTRANLTLVEQPVPEEDEQTKVSPKPLRGRRKSLAANHIESQSQTPVKEKDDGPHELKKTTNEDKTDRTEKAASESHSDAESPGVKKTMVKLKRFSSEKRISQSPPGVKQQTTDTSKTLSNDSVGDKDHTGEETLKEPPSDAEFSELKKSTVKIERFSSDKRRSSQSPPSVEQRTAETSRTLTNGSVDDKSHAEEETASGPPYDEESSTLKKFMVKLKRFSSEKRQASQSPPNIKQQTTESSKASASDSADDKTNAKEKVAPEPPSDAVSPVLKKSLVKLKRFSSDEHRASQSPPRVNVKQETTQSSEVLPTDSVDDKCQAEEKTEGENVTVEEKMETDEPTPEKQKEIRSQQVTSDNIVPETPETNTQSSDSVPETSEANVVSLDPVPETSLVAVNSLNGSSVEEVNDEESEPSIQEIKDDEHSIQEVKFSKSDKDAEEESCIEIVADDEEVCDSTQLEATHDKAQLNCSTFAKQETDVEPKDITPSSERQSPSSSSHVDETEAKKNSPVENKAAFAKSWSQSVKGTVNKSSDEPEFIDAISVKPASPEKSSPENTGAAIATKKEAKYQQSSEEEDEEEDEEERERSRNEFLDSEAMEVSDGEDSMSSGERAYLEENEISVKGESIGSEDTSEDEVEDEEDEKGSIASFILSDSEGEMLSGKDSLLGSDDEITPKKKYRRVVINEDSSSEGESNEASKEVEEVESSDLEKVDAEEVSTEAVEDGNTSISEHNTERNKSLDTSKASRKSIEENKKDSAFDGSGDSIKPKEGAATLGNTSSVEAGEPTTDADMEPSDAEPAKIELAVEDEAEVNSSSKTKSSSLGTSPRKDGDEPSEEVVEEIHDKTVSDNGSGLADSELNTSVRKNSEKSVLSENGLDEANEDEYDKLVNSGRESMSSSKSQSQLLDASNECLNSSKITIAESKSSQICNSAGDSNVEDIKQILSVSQVSPAIFEHSADDSTSEIDNDQEDRNLSKNKSFIKNKSLMKSNASRKSIQRSGLNDSRNDSTVSMSISKEVTDPTSPKLQLRMEDESESDNESRSDGKEPEQRMNRSSASVKNMSLLSNNLNKSRSRDNQISSKDDTADDDEELPGSEGEEGAELENVSEKNPNSLNISRTNRNWDKLNSSDQLEADPDELDDVAANSEIESNENKSISTTKDVNSLVESVKTPSNVEETTTDEDLADSDKNTTIVLGNRVNDMPPENNSQDSDEESGGGEEEPDEKLNKSHNSVRRYSGTTHTRTDELNESKKRNSLGKDRSRTMNASTEIKNKSQTFHNSDESSEEEDDMDSSSNQKLTTKETSCQETAPKKDELASESESEDEDAKEMEAETQKNRSRINGSTNERIVVNVTIGKVAEDGSESDKNDHANLQIVNKSTSSMSGKKRLSLNSSKRGNSSILQRSRNIPESSGESDAEEINNVSISRKAPIPLFQTLKMVDQSTPAEKYKIKLKINDKTYISSDDEGDATAEKAQTADDSKANISGKSRLNDTSFTISRTGDKSCAKNESIDSNKNSNKKKSKSKQRSTDKSLEKSAEENKTEISFIGSSDNSLENYAPNVTPKKKSASKTKLLSAPNSKARNALDTKPLNASNTKPLNGSNTKSLNVSIKKPVLGEKSSDSKTLKKKKAALESEILKEVLMNKINQAVKQGKIVDAKDRLGNNKNPNIPSGDQQVSAFAVYNLETKKKRKLSKNEDVHLKTKKLKSSEEQREPKETKVSKTEKRKKKNESYEDGTSSPQPTDWQVSDAAPKKKKLKILSDMPFGFQEAPATPKRVNGFEVTCATPKQVGWKVRSILSAGQKDIPEVAKKRVKNSARRDDSSSPSPKKVWTSVGYFEVSEADTPLWSRRQYKPEPLGAKTDFAVHSLSSKKHKVPESMEIYSSTALDFKRRANFNDKIKRESSKELLQKKIKKKF
ncbi:unnamed protein product [Hermetia illucens]|uniref:Uncharacterized protein n=1 Tax=Hermetia illucens TaxID=343691 RepID=A0A7R8UNI7_HERIL|nr:protein slender lobes isoform X2 [Hermetia illucens]CAD7084111.1 unnamed protein product [Hermetia illucens]